jgi:signal transduction histidine kinase
MIKENPRQDNAGISQELLLMLGSQVRLVPLPVMLSLAIIAVMAYESVPIVVWGTWLGVSVALQGLRRYVFGKLAVLTRLSARHRLRVAVVVNALNASAHACSLFFFPVFTPFERAVQSMLYVGLGLASVLGAAGYMPFTLTHILIVLGPMYALWAWSATLDGGGLIEVMIPVMGVIYAVTLYLVSRRVFRLFSRVFERRVELEEALSSAESAARAKTRFLASASHDLRQPIHTLSLFSASLGMRPLDDRSREIVGHIDNAIRSLASQLDSLLDVSKLDAGAINTNLHNFPLHPLLERLRSDVLPLAEQKGLTLTLDCPLDAGVTSDPALLERIISNLLGNAIRYTDEGGVELRVTRNEDEWDLEVADTGCGIPREEQQKIFEEFYQLQNPERDRTKGLGLGLAIVKRLASLLELQLELSSDPGRGSTFSLSLPAVHLRGGDDNGTVTLEQPNSGLVVLVVDDETDVRLGMKEILESFKCRVLLAEGTPDALTESTETRPDIALVDFRLRGDDNGIHAVRELRRLHPGLPSILISGDTDPERLKQANEAGIKLLHKPLLPEELLDEMAQACREART